MTERCNSVCVCEREREREREGGGGVGVEKGGMGERLRRLLLIDFIICS